MTETWKFWFLAILIPLLCCCCGVYKYKRRKGRRRQHGAGTHNFVLICTCTSSLYHRCQTKSPAKGSAAEHYLCFCFLKKKIICQLFCRIDFTLSLDQYASPVFLYTQYKQYTHKLQTTTPNVSFPFISFFSGVHELVFACYCVPMVYEFCVQFTMLFSLSTL